MSSSCVWSAATACRAARRKSRPSTAASVNVSSVAGASRSRRRPMTSFTPSGTATRASRGACGVCSSSSMKNGLPPVWSNSRCARSPSADPAWAATSAAVSAGCNPPEWDRVHADLPSEVGEPVTQRAAGVRPHVAAGREHQQSRSGAAAKQVPKQQQRRDIGPLQILEDEQQPSGAGGVQQQPHDRLEQLVPRAFARFLSSHHGWGSARTQLRHQARQPRSRGGLKRDLVHQPGAVGCVMPKCLHERLIRRDALLVGPAIEHDSTLGMRPRGEPRCQPRLADTRLADHRHDAALVARDLLPDVMQLLKRCRAADKRPRLESRQHGGQRNRALWPARVIRNRLCAVAGTAAYAFARRGLRVTGPSRIRARGANAARRSRAAGCGPSSPLYIPATRLESTVDPRPGMAPRHSGVRRRPNAHSEV